MSTKRPIRDLERELKKEPGNLAVRLQLAAAYREGLRTHEALELYRSVARAYAEQGRNGQAAAVCRSALELAPEDSELYGMLLHLERSTSATIVPPFGPPGGRAPTMPPPTGPSAAGTGPAPVVAQPGLSPASGTVSRTRVLPAEVSVRELGSVASTMKHVPPPPAPPAVPSLIDRVARGPSGPPISSTAPAPARGATMGPTPTPTPTPASRPSTLDVDTPLPDPLALHDTIGRDSVVEMAERLAHMAPTPQPSLRPADRSSTDDDGDTVIPLTQVRSPIRAKSGTQTPPLAVRPPGSPSSPPPPPPPRTALPRITSQTRPPPHREPASRPPPPRPPGRAGSAGDDAPDAKTEVRPEIIERPSVSDFAREMATRKRPKLSANDLALLDLVPAETTPTDLPLDAALDSLDGSEPGTDPGDDGASTTGRVPRIDATEANDPANATRDDHDDPAGHDRHDEHDDDEPTHPPGMTPQGLGSAPGVGSASSPSAGASRAESPRDTTLRGDLRADPRPPVDDPVSATFDRSFDATLLALGPDGAALEGPLGVFSMLPPEAAVELSQRAVVKQYAAGEVIIREGEPGAACYVIVHGEVAVHKRAPDGSEMVEIARLSDGSLFGEFALLADRRRHATVRAVTECEIYEIPRLLLRELAASYREVGPALESFYRERLLSNLLFTTRLFALVPDEQRPPLLSRFHPLHAESGQAIVRQGERAGGLYLIVLGAVEVVRRASDRRGVVLATLGEGSYFGEMSLLSGEMASASVIAAGPCELAVLPPRDFYEVVAASPELWSVMRVEADARRLANAQILAGHTGVV